ncbi:ECF transporter S component [Cellulomonas fimi]|uniref:ABC-type thiamin-related transport system, permease component 1, predicted n=1 Tax=Cellulomonas fimi (strain ATCC 484 / DSM 20113 / JCM 1341 / CCUG 24087 / LMG 16345 / NBRC 15513 / NCIMB 8980 / NCTC 7547 / NRS-133) TaxID=590998 RepID=F4H3G4_CELFA|nr:ECF transporter S component [Cellulomonas fimi]AEE46509.1 ABC-type thiamin-related transport system, permease component 1, predicted [Cellulomonas fimi ATCC 484]NNH08866.1 ECF transporter S component [Cellulomonas fimi]VEH33276.1 Putative HMP/thiamine permease protein ykoE [Cellulomonas fimi]
MSARARLTTSELVLLAVLAVVFGFLYWALVQAWAALQLAMGPFGDLAQHVLIGGWMVAAPLATYIVRKPGVGVVVELVAAFVEVAFLASPVGPMLLVVGLVQGVGAEAAFALTRYRRYGWGVFALSGVLAGLASTALGTVRFGWLGQDWFAWRLGLQVLSGLVLCGLLARVLGDALARTGVLDNTALGRARRASAAPAPVRVDGAPAATAEAPGVVGGAREPVPVPLPDGTTARADETAGPGPS